MTLESIELYAKAYRDQRDSLADAVQHLEDDVQIARRKHLAGIKHLVGQTKAAEHTLRQAIEASPWLFAKPKTQILHGIKVGFTKGRGVVRWAKAEQVVKLIRERMPQQADMLIKTTDTPVKSALMNIPAKDLRRIGVTLEHSGDQVVIRPTDTEVDKLVDALLKEDIDQ